MKKKKKKGICAYQRTQPSQWIRTHQEMPKHQLAPAKLLVLPTLLPPCSRWVHARALQISTAAVIVLQLGTRAVPLHMLGVLSHQRNSLGSPGNSPASFCTDEIID